MTGVSGPLSRNCSTQLSAQEAPETPHLQSRSRPSTPRPGPPGGGLPRAPLRPRPPGHTEPHPHSSLYLAFLQGLSAARPGSEPAWGLSGPRLPPPQPESRLTHVEAPSTGYLMRVSHIWDPQLPAPGRQQHKGSAPPGCRGVPSPSCSRALNRNGGSRQARFLAPMTSQK